MEVMYQTVAKKVGSINVAFDEPIKKINEYILECHKTYTENGYSRESLKEKPLVTAVLVGFSDLLNRLSDEVKKTFVEALEKGKDLGIINIIIVDSAQGLKKLEYESWYKTAVSNNRGIWLGNGIADQLTIKLAKTPRELRDVIDASFGYSVKNGIATLTKMVDYKEEKEDTLE